MNERTYSQFCYQDTEIDVSKGSFCFGPEVQFMRCNIILGAAQRSAVLVGGIFEQCNIKTKKRVVGYRFQDFAFCSCVMSGDFTGCDFGYWSGVSKRMVKVENCDFTNTKLDGCRFRNVDIKENQLPGWPCFSFRPSVLYATAKNMSWPGNLNYWVGIFESESDETSCVVESAVSVMRRFKSTERELVNMLTKCGVTIAG